MPNRTMRRARSLAGRIWKRANRLGLKPGEAPVILMYHRVAEPAFDPWGLCVAPDRFRQQMEMLKATRMPLPMDDLVAGLDRGDLPPRAVAITFDDGYSDNALIARPILDTLGVPATLFLTTGFVGADRLYWWDELGWLVLANPNSADFDFELSGVRLQARWPEQEEIPETLRTWRCDDASADTCGDHGDNPRRAAYLVLWKTLYGFAPAAREAALAELRARIRAPAEWPIAQTDRPMTAEMVRAFCGGGKSLGGHARSHTPLTVLPMAMRREEIAGGRDDIAGMTGLPPPSGFAFPHGSMDRQTRELVREAGYRWAVTSRYDVIHPRRYDRYKLPRMGVQDCNANELANELGG